MSLEQEFRISSEMADGVLTIHVGGDLDMASVPRISDVLGAFAGIHELIVDLTSCGFVDSSGVRELVLCRRDLGSDVPVTVVGVAPNVDKTFRMVGLDDVISIVAADVSQR